MRMTRQTRHDLFCWSTVAPSLLLILVFSYFSIVYVGWISFFKWDMLSPRELRGLRNYVSAFTNEEFWNAAKVTVVYSLVGVPASMIIGLGMGLLLQGEVPGKTAFRVCFFMPVVLAMTVAALVWRWIFNDEVGLINFVLINQLHLFPNPDATHWLRWLRDPRGGALAGVLVVGIWKQVGYNAILFLSGLENIPREYYEAARIDGAGPVQRFYHITLPLLAPTTFFVLVLQIISALKVTVSPMVMTGGGPVRSTESIVLYIYKEAFRNFRMGYASAVSVVVFLVLLLLTLFQFRVGEKRVHYQ
jgi:multiple sugar transport system permease protein